MLCENYRKNLKPRGRRKKLNFVQCPWKTLGKKLDAEYWLNTLGEYIIDAECRKIHLTNIL
jgi:hypothetical protein